MPKNKLAKFQDILYTLKAILAPKISEEIDSKINKIGANIVLFFQ